MDCFGHADRTSSRILVVDDLSLSQEIARSVLETGGYLVDVVQNGLEAVAAVRERRYELVLMDLGMPVMDGYAATAAIRAVADGRGRPPVVALTARGDAGEVERCRRVGMVGHVRKPFAPAHLLDAVRRWLRVPRDANPPDAAIWHSETYDGLVDRLGAGRLDDALALFRDKLHSTLALLGSRPDDRDLLDHECHGLTSTSGMFGFAKLSAVSREAFVADRAAPHRELVQRLRAAAEEVLERLDPQPV